MSDTYPRILTFTNPSRTAVPIGKTDADFTGAWKSDLHTWATIMLRIITNDFSMELQDGCAIDLFKRLHDNPFVKEFTDPVNVSLGVPADFVIPQGTSAEEMKSANELLANSV